MKIKTKNKFKFFLILLVETLINHAGVTVIGDFMVGIERVKTGITGFDSLIDKGIPVGSTVVVKGGPGSGKTIFCLQTCMNFAKQGKKCLYLSFEESEKKLLEHMQSCGGWKTVPENVMIKHMDIAHVWAALKIAIGKRRGVELLSTSDAIVREAELIPKGFNPDLVVFDSLSAVSSVFSESISEYRIYLEEIYRTLERSGALSLLIVEKNPLADEGSTFEEFMADGVFVLYSVRKGDMRESGVEVLKLRGTKHQKKIVAMQITDKGIVVYPEQQVFGLSETTK